MPDISPDTLLHNLAERRSAEVLALGCRLRDIVRHAVPDANEVVYHGALCYGRSAKRSELKVYISFHSTHVNLGFYRGALLVDPDGLLCGDGRQMRHIKVGVGHRCEARRFPAFGSGRADCRRPVSIHEIAHCENEFMPITPPCYAVIFSSTRTPVDHDYAETAARMEELAQSTPGFLGIESARNAEGFGITVSYWRDLESIAAWRQHGEHVLAQERGKLEWYVHYEIRIARVERAYSGPSQTV